MQYLLPQLTHELLGNLIVPNINSLNYGNQFDEQVENVTDPNQNSALNTT